MTTDRFDHLFIAPSSFDESFVFYVEELGWRVVSSWGDESAPRGAVIEAEGIRVVLAESHTASDSSWSGYTDTRRPVIHIAVPDVDVRHRELSGHLRVLVPPEDTHWGVRWMLVADPDGNVISFFHSLPGQPA
jgi:catechol 2,3-dioxygenase-like lactoylglutathione lyase family enzyme